MSTLRVNTLQNVAGTGDPSINGAAKAWVNFNGTGTVAIRASFNVSSITDNGTGDYTVNFTTAMADANYSLAGTTVGIFAWQGSAPTSSAVRVITVNSVGSLVDLTYLSFAIFR
jgi:hypothetical protein